jgi:hypothetical protein
MTLTRRFLSAKHWQLFVLMIGPPIIFQFFVVTNMIASFGQDQAPDPLFIFKYFKFFPFIMIPSVGTLFGWIWSVVIGLQDKVPAAAKFKTGRFKVFFFIPLVYITLLSFGMTKIFSNGFPMTNNPGDLVWIGGLMMIIFPLHLFSMFCIFHSIYYAAKTFKTVELQKATSFSDFAGEFFMLWFYFIGVWIVQPKVNKMVTTEIQNNPEVLN